MSSSPAVTTVPCPECGAQATGKFCNQCGTSLTPSACTGCGATLDASSRFCSACGTPVAVNTGRGRRGVSASASGPALRVAGGGGGATYLPWAIGAIAMLAVAGYLVNQNSSTATAGATAMAGGALDPSAAPFASGGGGGVAPDISQMSPRERAARLYDRIMRYVEEGKKDSAQFFAPMAMGSFEALAGEMDVDARYDYGRVASETGNFAVAIAQADTILTAAPTHLLGLSLAARTATLQGKPADADKVWKKFLAAKNAELQKKLPEYEMHAADIERATRLAGGGK